MTTDYETITSRVRCKVERALTGTFRTYELDGRPVLRHDQGTEWFNHDKPSFIDCRTTGSYDRSVTKDEFVELLCELMQQGERVPTNRVYRMHDNGERELVSEYEGKFSADYALYLYWAHNIAHCDYLNNANRRRYNGLRKISKTMRSAMLEVGRDVIICSATVRNSRSAVVGVSTSEYDYEPNYPKAA